MGAELLPRYVKLNMTQLTRLLTKSRESKADVSLLRSLSSTPGTVVQAASPDWSSIPVVERSEQCGFVKDCRRRWRGLPGIC